MASQLPGYYFDEEKRRYFKILPNHQAPKGAKYSKEALKTAARKRPKKQPLLVSANMLSRIQPSAILAHPLGGATFLRREHGVDPPRAGEGVYNAWASGLERATHVRAQQTIQSFAMDKETGTLLMMLDCMPGEDWYLHVRMPRTAPNDGRFLFEVMEPMLSSVNVSPSRFAIATSGDSNSSTMIITKLLEPERFLECYRRTAGMMPNDGLWQLIFSDAFQCFVTAPKPDPASTVFLVGGSRGTVIVTGGESRWETKMQYSARQVTSVDWLDANTYLTGERSGAVRLWDIRNDGMSLRFEFPSAINHAKKLGDQRIVVAGVQNNLMSYDLRSPLAFDANAMSRPYMKFDTYRNWDHNNFSTSLAVHENLIAASTDDNQVQLFNGCTGREIKIGSGTAFGNLGHQVRCLRFADHELITEDGTGPRLYVAAGPTVQEWTW